MVDRQRVSEKGREKDGALIDKIFSHFTMSGNSVSNIYIYIYIYIYIQREREVDRQND